MRPLQSWLLIAILSAHWMGGYLCFHMEYAVEVKDSMSELEKRIAAVLEEEMGAGIHVDIVDKALIETNNFGYSGRFIFSEEINGQIYYFEIISDPVEISYQKHFYSKSHQSKENKQKGISFEWRFSKFTLQDRVPLVPTKEVATRNYFYADSDPIFQPSIPSPPPKRIS